MQGYALTVLSLSWILWIWETYLDWRQYKVYKTTQQVPAQLKGQIDHETFTKSKAYSIDKTKLGFISSLYGQIQTTLTISCYLIAYFWNISGEIMTNKFGFSKTDSVEREIFQSLLFVLITSIISTVVNLPISIYSTFVVEQKHGFNKQTAGFYAWDKTKMFFISYLLTSPVVAATVYIVRNGGPYFFLYLWMFCFTVICLLMFFHGEIAALFDKFTPLPPGQLRDRIEELAKGVKFPLANIFVVEGSKRSAHSNAYQSGVFNRKRIVIYDTLIEGYYDKKDEDSEATEESKKKDKPVEKAKGGKGCTDDEIMGVLCHELGHWHCGHLFKQLAFAEINYFIMFVIFSRFYKDPSFYAAFGFSDMPSFIGLALVMMLLTPYNAVQGFIATSMSRQFEYQSDDYGKKKGYAAHLKTALVKLSIDNLGFPVHDELYSKYNHSHPTLIQRLKALDKVD